MYCFRLGPNFLVVLKQIFHPLGYQLVYLYISQQQLPNRRTVLGLSQHTGNGRRIHELSVDVERVGMAFRKGNGQDVFRHGGRRRHGCGRCRRFFLRGHDDDYGVSSLPIFLERGKDDGRTNGSV